ncbi:hypothetical protein [Anaerococcus lactolyticus]|uniref:hypothetical protein n=1 Tax=Anaerococcus lactolyticus TaxID=33032 RepID=UPI0023F3BFE9|nr:hypothetical protein [Anaerococcus lactolyticus]
MKLKKWQKNRIAYGWASELLPAHIEELKKKLEVTEDEYDQISLRIKIESAEEELQMVAEEYEKI